MAAKTTLESIPIEARGLVLDHLAFIDVLKATTTDRAGRAALSFVRHVSYIKDTNLMPNMLSKLARCESIDIRAGSAVVMERLAWVLRDLRNLRGVRIMFVRDADMSSWSRSCDSLARSMDDVSRIDFFRVKGIKQGVPLDPVLLGSESFCSILFKLPLDCALETSMYGQVPYDVVNSLLTRGANPNRFCHSHLDMFSQFRLSMLSKACQLQQVSVIRLLLEKGARSQALRFDSFHWTLVRVIRDNAAADHLDVLRLLYDAGFLSWTNLSDGGGLLHYLVSALMGKLSSKLKPAQFLPIVELVLERQPELATISDVTGRTPLTMLIENARTGGLGRTTGGFSKEAVAILKVLAEAERAARI
tara:strand:+ start:172 stop:1254 length:1083 start_codon:yes stop_codon:yes gene_type:complete